MYIYIYTYILTYLLTYLFIYVFIIQCLRPGCGHPADRIATRPISELRLRISAGSTRAESEARGAEFPGPQGIPREA